MHIIYMYISKGLLRFQVLFSKKRSVECLYTDIHPTHPRARTGEKAHGRCNRTRESRRPGTPSPMRFRIPSFSHASRFLRPEPKNGKQKITHEHASPLSALPSPIKLSADQVKPLISSTAPFPWLRKKRQASLLDNVLSGSIGR